MAVVEPIYHDDAGLVTTGNVMFILDSINGVDVKASNVIVKDLVSDTFGRVDFILFFLSFFRSQFDDGNVNFTIGDLKDESLVECGMLTRDEETFSHLV